MEQTLGPTISGALDFSAGSPDGPRFVVEDDGFPDLLRNALQAKVRSGPLSPLAWALRFDLRSRRNARNPLAHVMIWLGAGVDAADGRLRLGRRWLKPWERELKLDWNVRRSEPTVRAIIEVHRRLSRAGGGQVYVPLYWRLLRSLITVHPLGGCKMGTSARDGVVDHLGGVFGYRNLYVADGSVLPRAVGRNPAMTIAALAERTARLMAQTSA